MHSSHLSVASPSLAVEAVPVLMVGLTTIITVSLSGVYAAHSHTDSHPGCTCVCRSAARPSRCASTAPPTTRATTRPSTCGRATVRGATSTGCSARPGRSAVTMVAWTTAEVPMSSSTPATGRRATRSGPIERCGGCGRGVCVRH